MPADHGQSVGVRRIINCDDVFSYSLTIKPREDMPQKLRYYAEMHGITRNWLF